MTDIKQRFDRYLILDHLVDGGMAKICRARFLAEQADKIVAIKMIQPQYSTDEAFKKMFMDEVKVTFGLLHPNIVQTYDYGIHKDQLFIAMEYCDGRNLKEYLERLKEKKYVFPVAISVYIISQVCQGLHYAHTFHDKLTGKAANIIHRDISPHNIMLTYDGAVKIIDFGIAKASTNSEATQAGTIKGKLSYLAPEYIEGQTLDSRYDMFAVGITLWEMLCNRKLFKAQNDLAVLKKIQACKVTPPSKINPLVPAELDTILLKALHKDRNKRFENMEAFNRALVKFLYANYPDFNSSDLAYFSQELFQDKIKKDREKLFEFGKIDITPYLKELKNDGQKSEKNNVSKEASEVDILNLKNESSDIRKREQVLDFGFGENAKTKTSKVKRKEHQPKKRISKNIEEIPIPDEVNLQMNLPRAKKIFGSGRTFEEGEIEKSRKKRSKGSLTQTFTGIAKNLKTNQRHQRALGFFLFFVGILFVGRNDIPGVKILFGEPDNEVPIVEQLPEEPTPKLKTIINRTNKRNSLRISNYDFSIHKVFLNSEEVKLDYLKKVKITPNEDYFLRVERAGFIPYTEKFRIDPGSTKEITLPPFENSSFGQLYISKGCNLRGTISFELYGERRVENLPFRHTGISFPVMGDGRTPANENGQASYTIYLKKDGKKGVERKINVSFKEDQDRVDLCNL